jgi:hexaprenyl-diphosphate synthase
MTSFADRFPMNIFSHSSVQETVKETILNEAVREDSHLWSNSSTVNGFRHVNGHSPVINGADSINDSVMASPLDALEDLYRTETTRFWPSLPPGILLHAAEDVTTAPVDPVALANGELQRLSASIRNDLIGTDHPVLNQAAAYFFDTETGGKKVRPMMVLLLSRALADTVSQPPPNEATRSTSQRLPHKVNGTAAASGHASLLLTEPIPGLQRSDLPDAQRRLAEISEMIHTASLFHDDVIDGSDTRRNMPTAHTVFGNKMAILAGDYLLARASICLARLRNVDVVETMSTIIEHLVRGEVMQLRGTTTTESSCNERLLYYLRKNFYKTASLMANSCKSTALLGNYSTDLIEASYKFGKHVGMAFQLVDDVLDFEGSAAHMGKPALSDLNAGLATAPVLFAAEEYPDELEPLIRRKFKQDGDVDRAVELVLASNGMERTKNLARVHAECAMEALLVLKPSLYRDALVHLSSKVVSRTK